MTRFHSALLVARFDLLEAVHSKTATLLGLVYASSAFIGTSVFLSLLESAEDTARQTLSTAMKVPADELPRELIRERALPWLLAFVRDDATRARLLEMDPLSIFFGFATLQAVALLVLLPATSSIGTELERGGARFVLPRCDRLGYGLGKLLSQGTLLALGLAFAAVVTAVTGSWLDGAFEPSRLGWLLRMALQSWIFGMAYVGVFVGLTLAVGSVSRARLAAIVGWLAMTLVSSALSRGADASTSTAGSWLDWLFPSHYRGALWSPDWVTHGTATLVLFGIGAAAFGLGSAAFRSRDA